MGERGFAVLAQISEILSRYSGESNGIPFLKTFVEFENVQCDAFHRGRVKLG